VRIIWYRSARADLARLRAYIAESDPGSARVVLARIFDSVRTLEVFSQRGRTGQLPDTRELIVPRTPYIVAYRISDDVIEVLRVIHGAQRWPAI